MKEILSFLSDLYANNNREWFADNKERYLKVQEDVNDMALRLIDGISAFDPSVAGNTLKSTTYRIYRDIRFSPDKSPYKTHIGIYIARGGKKSGYAGYYTHFEPDANAWLGGNLLCAGLFMPEKKALNSVREDILLSGEKYKDAIERAKGFNLVTEGALKKLPPGFPADTPYTEYLKLKDFLLNRPMDDRIIKASDPVSVIVDDFRETYEFVALLNRSVEYAFEEM